MARQTGENSPIINSIQVPQLTDIATGNYQNVINKTLDNYSQAMKSLEAKMTVDNTDWKRMRQKNEDYESQVQAVQRANAQSGGGGSDWGSALANIGKSLVSGLVANEQLQAQQEQQAFENNLATEKLNLTKQEYQARLQSEQQSAAREQLTSLVQSRLSEIEGEAYKIIQNGSYNDGIAYAEAQVGKLTTNPFFASLSDANKFYAANLGQTFLTRIRKENLNQVRGEQDKIEDSTINLAQTQWQYQSVSLLKGIETGAGTIDVTTVEKGVKQLIQSAQDIVQKDPSLSAILTDKSKYIKYYTGVLTQINGALEKYYGQSGQWSSETNRYKEAINQISNLDALRNVDPKFTEGDYQRAATLVLTGLGLSPDVSKIPTTQVNVARLARERQQEIEKTNNALTRSENLRMIQEGNPAISKAKDYLISREVFNTITNSNSSSLNTTISKLEYYIKEQPDVAQSRGYQAQLALLTKYRTEQEKVTTLQANAHKLEGELAALGFKINPPDLREYIQPAGTPLGVTQGVSPKAEVQILRSPQTIPQASQEQFDAKARELQSNYDLITNLATFWADNGINIFNPKDDQYIKKLEASSQAARDTVKQTPEYNQYQPSDQPAPTETGGVTPEKQEDSVLLKALNFEIKRNAYEDVTTNFIKKAVPDEKSRATLITPIGDRISELDTKYLNAVRNLASAYDGGNTTDIEELKNTLVYNKAGMSEGQIKFMDSLMNEQSSKLDKLDKFLQGKSQWYRLKFGQIQSNRTPTNFSQGSGEPKRASQTPLPNQTQPLSPTMPLAGNLAKTKYGFAPFKGGTISFTSDFQASGRFGRTARPRHNGIDIVSTDPRVATIQGGTVVVSDMSKINPDGYGNVVVVKTGDGTYELFGHLKTINVKVGDIIDPATQIGIMGSSGRSDGAHTHFGVSTTLNTKNLTATSWLDPVQYLQKVSVKATLPRGQGAKPSSNTNTVEYSNSGFFKISENLTYMHGYVLDRSTGTVRKATQSEQANIKSYTPIGTVRSQSNNQPNQTNYNSQVGETITERWVIPKQAEADKDFLFVHPTGRNTSNGNTVLAIEGYRNGKKVFSVEAVSGRTGVTGDRDTPGVDGMLPDGSWTVARSDVASSVAGVGGRFLPLTYNGRTNRAAIGIHYDADNDKGSAGCLATLTKADRDKVYQFVNSSNRQLRLYVNTKNVQRDVSRASSINSPNGNSTSSIVATTSPYRSAYTGKKNDPTANYGYSVLRNNPRYARALAEGADKVGVPAVWLADLIGSETDWRNIERTDGKAAGLFQAIPETLIWLGRATIGRPMTKQEFINKGVEWQLSVAFPAYLNIISKDAGKGYNSMGDVLAAVWGGKKSLSRDPKDRQGNVYETGLSWNQRMGRMGRSVGRSYDPQSSLPTIIHDAPRDSCATCNQMLLNGSFTTHSIKGLGDIPSNYA